MANESEKNTETNGNVNTETEKEKAPDTAELEAKIKQLEAENGKLRQANTNASADASKWKKQYQEMLPEKERLEREKEEQDATLRKELEALKAERNVANYKSSLTAPDIGMNAELAQEMAEAMNAGDGAENIFGVLRRFLVAHDKQLKENAFRNNPTLQGGGTSKAVSKEAFDKMGYAERLEVFKNYPDLYNEYTK